MILRAVVQSGTVARHHRRPDAEILAVADDLHARIGALGRDEVARALRARVVDDVDAPALRADPGDHAEHVARHPVARNDDGNSLARRGGRFGRSAHRATPERRPASRGSEPALVGIAECAFTIPTLSHQRGGTAGIGWAASPTFAPIRATANSPISTIGATPIAASASRLPTTTVPAASRPGGVTRITAEAKEVRPVGREGRDAVHVRQSEAVCLRRDDHQRDVRRDRRVRRRRGPPDAPPLPGARN